MMTVHCNTAASRWKRTGVVLLTSAALLATTFQVQAAPAAARAPIAKSEIVSADGTEFSARKRYRRGGNAAGIAMMGMMIGAIGGMVAAQQRREAAQEAYNRAYAYQAYPYAQRHVRYHQPQPYVHHQRQPFVHHRAPVYHGRYVMDDGRPPGGPIVNGNRIGW